MGLYKTSDKIAGKVAETTSTLGQISLICLGVHFAADQLDDKVLFGFHYLENLADIHLSSIAQNLAEKIGLEKNRLLIWTELPLEQMSTIGALLEELLVILIMARSIILSPKYPKLSFKLWKSVFSINAVVLPFTFGTVLIAGGWSMAMAVEDIIQIPYSSVLGAIIGLLVVWRFGVNSLLRAIGALEKPNNHFYSLIEAIILLPIGILALIYGIPVWGLL